MKVKLLTALSGPGGSHGYGTEIDMEDAESVRFVEAGLAVPVSSTEYETTRQNLAKMETATAPAGSAAAGEVVNFAKLKKDDIPAKAKEVYGLELDPKSSVKSMLAAINEHVAKTSGEANK